MAEQTRDKDELQSVFNGCSISLLSQIFGLDPREVAKRITPLAASGTRNGYPVYELKEAARYLVEPIVDMEDFIQSMKPSDLPVPVQKAYWEGRLARQRFEENAKLLWRTEKVMDVFVNVFKKLRSTLVMFDDTVEAAAGTTEAQRRIMRQIADGLLNDLRDGLIEEFQLNAQTNELQDAA